MWEKAIGEIVEYCKKDVKENGEWKDGDEKVFVCKDGVVIVSTENRQTQIKVITEKPVDMTHLELGL